MGRVRQLLRRWWVKLIVVAVIAAGAWAGYRHFNPPPPPPPPPSGEATVADITQIVQAAGVLQPKLKVDVGAQVSGQISKLHVQLGQQVRKGDLLVSLDPELARSDVAQAEAALAQQRALIDSRNIDLATLRRELARQQRLMAGQATAGVDLERAEADLGKLEAELRGAQATAQRLEAELAKVKLRLSYTSITAPMDGTVVNLPVQEGQTVIAIQITPVMVTLADMDQVTVRARVPEADIASIRPGQVARFITLSGEAQRYAGKVRVIQPVPERAGNAVFYNVLFEVDNRERRLLSDMTVQVSIETGQVKGVLTVPMVALGERGDDGRYDVTLLDAKGQQQPGRIKVGLQDGARIQVLDGLKAGDKVLLAPPSPAQAASAASAAAAASSAASAASAAAPASAASR